MERSWHPLLRLWKILHASVSTSLTGIQPTSLTHTAVSKGDFKRDHVLEITCSWMTRFCPLAGPDWVAPSFHQRCPIPGAQIAGSSHFGRIDAGAVAPWPAVVSDLSRKKA
jgi:hypothetical protein